MLIVGCGNLLRGDDGIGVHVVRELEKLSLPGKARIIDAGTRSLDMLFQMEAADKVIIIDAVKGGSEPGTIYRLTKEDLSSAEVNPISLHELKLEDALRMGDRIWGQRSPREIVIFGIEAGSLTQGVGLSPQVKKCLPKLVNLILQELWSPIHELALTQSIVSIALSEVRRVGGKRVTRISLALGDMSGLTEESMRSCFDLFSRDTIAAGAILSFRPTPGWESYVESIEVE